MLGQVVQNLYWDEVPVASLSEQLLVEAGLGSVSSPGPVELSPCSLYCPGHTPGDSLVVPLMQQVSTGWAGAVRDENSTRLYREVSVLLCQLASLCSFSRGAARSLPSPVFWGSNSLS